MKRATDFKMVPGKKSRTQPRMIFLEKWGHQRFPGISVRPQRAEGKRGRQAPTGRQVTAREDCFQGKFRGSRYDKV